MGKICILLWNFVDFLTDTVYNNDIMGGVYGFYIIREKYRIFI